MPVVGKRMQEFILAHHLIGSPIRQINGMIGTMIAQLLNKVELTSNDYQHLAHDQVTHKSVIADIYTSWTLSLKSAIAMAQEKRRQHPEQKYYLIRTKVNLRDPRVVVIHYDLLTSARRFVMRGFTGGHVDDEEEVVVFKAIDDYEVLQIYQ